MKFKLIEKIKNTGEFKVVKTNLYFVKNTEVFIYPLKEILKLDEYWGVTFEDQLIHVFTNRSFNTFYDYKGNKIRSFEKVNFYHIFSKDDFIYYDRSEKKSKYNSFTLFEGKIGLNHYNNNHLFFENELVINNYSLLNKTFLWHFDLSQFAQWKNFEDKDRNYEVEQFVGVSGGCLYVLLSNFKLIALNVETGELLHQLNLGDLFALEPRNWLSYSSKMHLDEVNNRIIWLTSATLLHIDLTDFNAKLIKDFFNVPIENLWRFKCSNYQDQKLLFTAQYGREGGDPDIVGIMNPDTGEILWQYQIPNTQGLYEAPQLANNQLYVRSLDNNLYIFEKE